MISARISGALAYGAAAAGAGVGALYLSGDALELKTLREVAPLAFVLGGLAGYGVVSAWPRRVSAAILTAVVTAMTVLVFFSAFFLLGDGVIAAAMGDSAVDAVQGASARLRERLPLAAPLALGAFAAAGFLLWALATLGRWFRRPRSAPSRAAAPRTTDA